MGEESFSKRKEQHPYRFFSDFFKRYEAQATKSVWDLYDLPLWGGGRPRQWWTDPVIEDGKQFSNGRAAGATKFADLLETLAPGQVNNVCYCVEQESGNEKERGGGSERQFERVW
ncbi:hypothetical protein PoB_007524100 [Plakobranchus ocellatus]|uniref:Uncharacterized protein n=1 Tax=Plakobranchus ocellatus TaxID=259542 RepID=A0AAV4DY21_9GAST|nr:hypothetical protein PoB_007524100 [Plakobranchus ocellatus]